MGMMSSYDASEDKMYGKKKRSKMIENILDGHMESSPELSQLLSETPNRFKAFGGRSNSITNPSSKHIGRTANKVDNRS